MRILLCGFELNSTTAGVELDAIINSSTVTISAATFRSGAYALRSKPTGSVAGNARINFFATSTQGVLYIRAYINVAAVGSTVRDLILIQDASGNSKISVRLNTDATLQLRNLEDGATVGSNSGAVALGTWYRVELKIDTTTLATTAVEARIDGVAFASGTVNLTAGMARLQMGCQATDTTYDVYFDDVAINDGTGSFQNSWPGSGKIIHLRPSAAGDANTFATQTGGTAGAGNNFTRVNQVTPDDTTTFNGSEVLNQEDLFNVDDSGLGPTDTINVVAVGVRFRNSTADTTGAFQVELEKTAAGTKATSAAIIPNSATWKSNALVTPFAHPLVTYQDPDSAPWTNTTLDSMQIGYKDTAAPAVAARRNDISAVWALVDYSPAVVSTWVPKTVMF